MLYCNRYKLKFSRLAAPPIGCCAMVSGNKVVTTWLGLSKYKP